MKALLCAVVLVLTPSIAAALPFIPDQVEWTVLDSRFEETGTNEACVNCDDADPSNDLTLTLNMFNGGGCCGGGSMIFGAVNMTGDLESIRDVSLGISADIRLTARLVIAPPEELAEFPLPSVAFGHWFGFLRGENVIGGPGSLGGSAFVEDCCFGEIGGASFKSPQGPSLWMPTDNVGFAGEVHWAAMPYTPEVTAVPEPTTLVLLGSGLIAARLQRSRHRRQRPL